MKGNYLLKITNIFIIAILLSFATLGPVYNYLPFLLIPIIKTLINILFCAIFISGYYACLKFSDEREVIFSKMFRFSILFLLDLTIIQFLIWLCLFFDFPKVFLYIFTGIFLMFFFIKPINFFMYLKTKYKK